MDPSKQKQTQFILFASFVVLVVFLTLQVQFLMPRRAPSQPDLAIVGYALAAAAAVGCAGWVMFRLKTRAQVGEEPVLPEPNRQQTNVVVALAIGEIPALLGIVFGIISGVSMFPFMLLSLILFFFLILPCMMDYWQRYENRA